MSPKGIEQKNIEQRPDPRNISSLPELRTRIISGHLHAPSERLKRKSREFKKIEIARSLLVFLHNSDEDEDGIIPFFLSDASIQDGAQHDE